jgi:hypothetical protein
MMKSGTIPDLNPSGDVLTATHVSGAVTQNVQYLIGYLSGNLTSVLADRGMGQIAMRKLRQEKPELLERLQAIVESYVKRPGEGRGGKRDVPLGEDPRFIRISDVAIMVLVDVPKAAQKSAEAPKNRFTIVDVEPSTLPHAGPPEYPVLLGGEVSKDGKAHFFALRTVDYDAHRLPMRAHRSSPQD